jgi:hypothetical protein
MEKLLQMCRYDGLHLYQDEASMSRKAQESAKWRDTSLGKVDFSIKLGKNCSSFAKHNTFDLLTN